MPNASACSRNGKINGARLEAAKWWCAARRHVVSLEDDVVSGSDKDHAGRGRSCPATGWLPPAPAIGHAGAFWL
ncbi:hypothetical protein [Streptomyces cadmiisoli]|uniref:hypothetical protein n=1 Tax=Streptomyces cadmiisoli TaxID=2184053 RepID=UPI0013A6F7DC|nr:hypothetical protein [Streptomyces cadmiisoli]